MHQTTNMPGDQARTSVIRTLRLTLYALQINLAMCGGCNKHPALVSPKSTRLLYRFRNMHPSRCSRGARRPHLVQARQVGAGGLDVRLQAGARALAGVYLGAQARRGVPVRLQVLQPQLALLALLQLLRAQLAQRLQRLRDLGGVFFC